MVQGFRITSVFSILFTFIRFDVSAKDKTIISNKLICSIIFNKDFETEGSRKGDVWFIAVWKREYPFYRRKE